MHGMHHKLNANTKLNPQDNMSTYLLVTKLEKEKYNPVLVYKPQVDDVSIDDPGIGQLPHSKDSLLWVSRRMSRHTYGGIRRSSASPRPPCDGSPSVSVRPSPRQTPGPPCPYPSDRTENDATMKHVYAPLINNRRCEIPFKYYGCTILHTPR